MLNRLQQKWKVSPGRLLLILITFAVGGSATGYVGRKLMGLMEIENPWLFIPIYIIVVTILWPLMVLMVSIPFGQFVFFRNYIRKLGRKLTGKRNTSIEPAAGNEPPVEQQVFHVAIFASGTGSNAKKIIDYFRHHQYIKVSLVACNKPGAGVLSIAEQEGIPVLLIEKERFFRGDAYVESLQSAGIGLVVLAGFLWKVPQKLIEAYRNAIINIHPALLPKYGGKGLYGSFVHEAVLNAREKESGITIHYVDEEYDHGDAIFQARVAVDENDTPATLAQKIQVLEHKHFPEVIEELVKKQNHR